MQFTIDVWRGQVAQKVQDLKSWLDRRRREDVPYLLYGTLSGLTLWPLVEAAAATAATSSPSRSSAGLTGPKASTKTWSPAGLPAKPTVTRVLRGASYAFDENWLRCAACYWFHPDRRSVNRGFRVVVSPATSAL